MPGFQVLHAHHVGAQQRRGQLVTHVPAGAQQLGRRCPRRVGSPAPVSAQRALVADGSGTVLGRAAMAGVPTSAWVKPHCFSRAARGGVAFGVDGGGVQRLGLAPGRRRKPAHCSKALGPSPLTFFSWARVAKAPSSSRRATTFFGGGGGKARHPGQQRGAGGVQVHAHGVDAVLHHAVQRVACRRLAGMSCWYWPTPTALGSILTSSARGSCRRRAMDTALRRFTSILGELLRGQLRWRSRRWPPPR